MRIRRKSGITLHESHGTRKLAEVHFLRPAEVIVVFDLITTEETENM